MSGSSKQSRMNRSAWLWQAVRRFSKGRGAMTLVDQIMVSIANFATNIVLVRGLGLSEYGKYSIAYILLLYVNALQMSFVSSPMLSIAPLLHGKNKQRFVNGMLAAQIIASFVVFFVLSLIGFVSHTFSTFYSLRCILAFACCAGTFQIQDWIRRYYFLYSKGDRAITCDFINYVIQLAVLAGLWHYGLLSLFRVFVVMCVTSVAALSMGPLMDGLWPSLSQLRNSWAHCKGLSHGLLIANQVRWFGIQGVLLIGTWIVGVTAAGGLRATQSLAGPVFLILISLENVIPIRLAEELTTAGCIGAYRFMQRAICGGTVLMSVLLLPIAISGRSLLQLFYGPTMATFYLPMLAQLAAIIVQIPASLWVYFYRSVRDTRALLFANCFSALASIGTVYWFGHLWGALGIVLSSLLGTLIAVTYYAFHWTRSRDELLLRYPATTDPATHFLRLPKKSPPALGSS